MSRRGRRGNQLAPSTTPPLKTTGPSCFRASVGRCGDGRAGLYPRLDRRPAGLYDRAFSQWPAPGSELGGNRPRLLWGMVAAMLYQPPGVHHLHPAPGLQPRLRQPPLAKLQLRRHTLQIRGAKTAPSRGLRPRRLAVDRRRSVIDGRADLRPQPLGPVAFASHRLRREHGPDHGQYLVLDLSRLADQGHRPQGRRPLPQDRALLPRRRPRGNRRRRLLAPRRRVHRDGGHRLPFY